MSYKLVEAKGDLLMLMLAYCGSLVVARVFMVSLTRVLESLKDCTSLVIKMWYVHVLHLYTYI